VPGGSISEVFNTPVTAHILGGAAIGTSPERGVVDPYHRVFGYEGLHVVDGSSVSANLGVNPSLTIAAQAERAMSFWPNKGDPDPRPRLGHGYERIDPVPPVHRPYRPTPQPPSASSPERDPRRFGGGRRVEHIVLTLAVVERIGVRDLNQHTSQVFGEGQRW
jgi:hypothetical protein